MPLTPKQAFKVGFLYRCAEEGLSKEATEQRVSDVHEKTSGITGAAARMAWLLPLLGIGAGGLAGHMVGGALGKAKAEASGSLPSEGVSEEVRRLRHAELISAYERQTREAKRRAASAKRRNKRDLKVVSGY